MSNILNNNHLSSHPFQKKSLNKTAREKAYMQITRENKALLRRLQNKPASYSVKQWDEERKRTEQRLRNICEYPYKLGDRQESQTRLQSEHQHTRNRSSAISKSSVSPLRSAKTAPGTTFSKELNIGDTAFLVKIQPRRGLYIITAKPKNDSETFTLELTRKDAESMMKTRGNFQGLVLRLHFEDGDLVLVDDPSEQPVINEPNTQEAKPEDSSEAPAETS